jgi:hypothetical protein
VSSYLLASLVIIAASAFVVTALTIVGACGPFPTAVLRSRNIGSQGRNRGRRRDGRRWSGDGIAVHNNRGRRRDGRRDRCRDGRRDWSGDGIAVRNNRGATGLSNFIIYGILRGLTEVVARTANSAIHYIAAVIRVCGITVVSHLMSQKLALHRETAGEADLVHACVPTTGFAKSSNISAPNIVSFSEVVAVKEMNNIGIDVRASNIRASNISTKSLKQPAGVGTDIA